MKTTVIHHSADYDGIFCREIARKFLPDAELIGWDFGDKPPDDKLLREELIIMDLPVDRPFGIEFKKGWICRNGEALQPVDRWDSSNLIWIDHHASSIASHPPELPGYRIDGVAACRLAWQWFAAHFGGEEMNDSRFLGMPEKKHFVDRFVYEPLAVRLAGEYDIWDKRDPAAELLQHGLRSQELEPEHWQKLLSLTVDGLVAELLKQGKCLQYAQRKQDAFVAQHRSFDVTWEGLKFMAVNATRCNSLTFEAAVRPDHDALMGFFWNGKEWTVSLYHAPHRKDLDLAAIATRYGGGGHKGACGFRTTKLPFVG
jgi:uncharacterized protein